MTIPNMDWVRHLKDCGQIIKQLHANYKSSQDEIADIKRRHERELEAAYEDLQIDCQRIQRLIERHWTSDEIREALTYKETRNDT